VGIGTWPSGRCLPFDLRSLLSGRLSFLGILKLLNLTSPVGSEGLISKSFIDGFNLLGIFRHVFRFRIRVVSRGFGQLIVNDELRAVDGD